MEFLQDVVSIAVLANTSTANERKLSSVAENATKGCVQLAAGQTSTRNIFHMVENSNFVCHMYLLTHFLICIDMYFAFNLIKVKYR